MCVFCEIVKGKIPTDKIYEDGDVLAFLDIKPNNPGHTLVVPKKHYQNLEDIDEVTLSKLIIVVKKVGLMLKEKLGVVAYNVVENNDPQAGQVIPHIHFHLIPRYDNDGLRFCERLEGSRVPVISQEEIIDKLKC